jgi:K+-transporting ATPase KdpF subunit
MILFIQDHSPIEIGCPQGDRSQRWLSKKGNLEESERAGRNFHLGWHRLFYRRFSLPVCLRPPVRFVMSFELIFGGVIAVGMLVYLTFALLRPEKF